MSNAREIAMKVIYDVEFNGAYVSVTEKNANPARIVQLWNEKMKENRISR